LSFITCAAAQVQKNNFHGPSSVGRVSSAPVEMKVDPCFRSELDNSRAKIFEVEVAAHQSTGLDIHRHDYVVLALDKASFKVAGMANSFPMELGPGEMQVLQGGWPERLVNESDTPLRLVELEVEGGIDPGHPRCGLAAAECTDGEFGSDNGGGFTTSTLFETHKVKLSRVDLDPGATLPKHTHVDSHVLIALADMKLSDQETDKGAKELQLKAGEVVWYEGEIEHTLTNLGAENAPIITVEFKN
jgi:quercetin dioxygenase-like cupin family protein